LPLRQFPQSVAQSGQNGRRRRLVDPVGSERLDQRRQPVMRAPKRRYPELGVVLHDGRFSFFRIFTRSRVMAGTALATRCCHAASQPHHGAVRSRSRWRPGTTHSNLMVLVYTVVIRWTHCVYDPPVLCGYRQLRGCGNRNAEGAWRWVCPPHPSTRQPLRRVRTPARAQWPLPHDPIDGPPSAGPRHRPVERAASDALRRL